MSANEVIIISENPQGTGETTIIEVMEDQNHFTAAEVIEAILDPTPDVEIHDYLPDLGGEPSSGLTAQEPNEQVTSESHAAEDHVAAAIDAQQHSDDAVAAGDYATA